MTTVLFRSSAFSTPNMAARAGPKEVLGEDDPGLKLIHSLRCTKSAFPFRGRKFNLVIDEITFFSACYFVSSHTEAKPAKFQFCP